MSEKYHDYYPEPPNKTPYTTYWWNKLVYRVDMALKEGTFWSNRFQPPLIHPIEDGEHIWSKDDLKELRASLKEMCPDNVRFTVEGERANGQGEFEFWGKEALDEIQDEINYWSWCDFPQLAEDFPGMTEEDMADYCLSIHGDIDPDDFCWAFLWDDTLEVHHAYIDQQILDGR